jgi:hypothetical protein
VRDGAAEAVSEEVVCSGGRRGLSGGAPLLLRASPFPFFLPFPGVPGTHLRPAGFGRRARGESFGLGGCIGQARCQAPIVVWVGVVMFRPIPDFS